MRGTTADGQGEDLRWPGAPSRREEFPMASLGGGEGACSPLETGLSRTANRTPQNSKPDSSELQTGLFRTANHPGGLGPYSDEQSAATIHAAVRQGPLLDRALLASISLCGGEGGVLTSCSLLRWGDSTLDSRAASRTRC